MVFGIDPTHASAVVAVGYLGAVTAVMLYFAVVGSRQESHTPAPVRSPEDEPAANDPGT